jgi:prepilin-type N-terminal cleavage/methylation domain-containing protein
MTQFIPDRPDSRLACPALGRIVTRRHVEAWGKPHGYPAGFTLVELLVVITIIGMLAGMALGALYSARESARVAKTQATITKLDVIIQARYAEFFSRRMPIPNRRMPPDAMAELRFRVLHEIMRMEMPDRISDITFPRSPSNTSTSALDVVAADIIATVHPVASFTDAASRGSRTWIDTNGSTSTATPGATDPAGIQRTALAKRYWRKVYAGISSGSYDIEFDNAECLYMIVNADPDAREQFQPNEIGDADGDGFFEFHDGWDMPIMFLRWAPGFVSESELMKGVDDDGDPTTPLVGDPENDPDPIRNPAGH